ncbi:VOC family protein [Tepidicaulis sp. LMO-SS28]|uniref:VOC family protein n=1 Tax=Tepidicaulis sp. LMO-SS28 TaxID=3447455 RepID=UPI003EDF86BF
MTGDFRLRQIAFVSADLEKTVEQLNQVFGLEIGFRDPGVMHYGLKNAVLPVGNDFIEIVEPVKEGASAGRYLQRRGGDGGYMVILQAEDEVAHRERLKAQGVRVVDVLDMPRHKATHYHPKDFGGILASIDTVPDCPDWREPDTDWFPAGADWRGARNEKTLGLAAASIQSADPNALAEQWSGLLDVPLRKEGGAYALDMLGGTLRFIAPLDERGTGIAGLDIRVPDPAVVLSRAQEQGLPVEDGAVLIAGGRLKPVPA